MHDMVMLLGSVIIVNATSAGPPLEILGHPRSYRVEKYAITSVTQGQQVYLDIFSICNLILTQLEEL